ncbi:MAG: hypothetical protein M3441_27460, partial [Chloroflexota bacterium]|nr:hypothetical protein [Chloroflexota bacterium]
SVVNGKVSIVSGPRTTPPEARPWTPSEAMVLAWFLLLTVVVLVSVFLVADRLAGTKTAAAITAGALLACICIAALVLRSSGRLSEERFLDTLKHVLHLSFRTEHQKDHANPQTLSSSR